MNYEYLDNALNNFVKFIDDSCKKIWVASDVILDPPEKEEKIFEGFVTSKFRNIKRPTTKEYKGTQLELDEKYKLQPDSFDELFIRIDEKNILVSKKVFNKVKIGDEVKLKISYIKPQTFQDLLFSIHKRSYSLKLKGKWFGINIKKEEK